ncbi:MAG: methyltransferase domain-containing protein [Acidimicrobiales bacterium]
MSTQRDQYTHGHHESVLRSHKWRTAQNSAGFLLSHLGRGDELLDVGCGPGTISADLARLVDPGHVRGIDISTDVIDIARSTHEDQGLTNLSFAVDDVYALSFADASFNVVFAHQILQHLSDPISALCEMRRVLRDEGILAVREADFAAFAWSPTSEHLDRWMQLYHQVTAANSAEADAGRHLPGWVRAAGFHSLEVSSSNWTYYSDEERRWWGELWAERVMHSDFATQGLAYGFTTTSELREISRAFRAWADDEDGLFIVVNAEVLARR